MTLNDFAWNNGHYIALFRRIRYSFRGQLLNVWLISPRNVKVHQLSTTDALCSSQ